MGSSISENEGPRVIVEAPKPAEEPKEVVETKQLERVKSVSIVQHIEVSNVETVEQFMKPTNDKSKPEPRKSMDASAAVLYRPRRELPPLKKIRSLKRMDLDEHFQKENTSLKKVQEFLQKDSHMFLRNKGTSSEIEVSELKETDENEDLNKIRQTRTKKMRVTKNLGISSGAYF